MKKILPERDPQGAYEDLLATAMELYEEPYNDEDGPRDEDLPSLRNVADAMDTTILRVRKLLITGQMFSTETSRWVQELAEDGLSTNDIMKQTGLSRASVYSYIPYKGRAFNLEDSSLNADRQKKGRDRAKAIKKLRESMSNDYPGGLDDWREDLWAAVKLFAGYRFKTTSGKRFTYAMLDGGIRVGTETFTREEVEAAAEEILSNEVLDAILLRVKG